MADESPGENFRAKLDVPALYGMPTNCPLSRTYVLRFRKAQSREDFSRRFRQLDAREANWPPARWRRRVVRLWRGSDARLRGTRTEWTLRLSLPTAFVSAVGDNTEETRASKQQKEADDEGDCGDGSGCGNGRG